MSSRKSIRGIVGALAVAALAIPALAGCSPLDASPTASDSPAGPPVEGGSAVLAIQDNPVNMDPADGQLYASIQVYQNIFDTLINVDADFGFVPNLASEWKQDDPLTWSFTLVENAVFHNGEPLTADDVAFSIERMKTHPLGAFISDFESVEVVDPYHFKIHLARPYGAMEATLASFVQIVNKKAVESSDPKETPVGTGPYKMTEWVKGSHVTLSRWDQYFKDDRPYLDEVTFQSVPDDSVRLAGLQTGQFDWIQTVPAQQVPELLDSATIDHTEASAYFPYLIQLNTTAGPFMNQAARQALNWAIDRSEIVKLAFSDQAVEASEAVSEPNPFYSGVNVYEGAPDIDKATELLDEAALASDDLVILVEQEVSAYTLIAQVLQSQLEKIGLNATIETASSAEYFGRMASHDYDIAITYFSASLDPSLTYYLLGHSTSGFNFTGYASPTLDAILEEFTFNSDQDARKEIYPDLVTAFQEESPFIILANRLTQYWTLPTLHGAETLPTLEIRAADLWTTE